MDVDEIFSWTVGVTLLIQKVDVVMRGGGLVAVSSDAEATRLVWFVGRT